MPPLTYSQALEMARIRSTINPIELLTPTNYLAEKQKWLDNGRKFFNPQFTYDIAAIENAIHQISSLIPVEDLVRDDDYYYNLFSYYGRLAREALVKRVEELTALRTLLEAIVGGGSISPFPEYRDSLLRLYGDISLRDIIFAEMLIKETPEDAYWFIWNDTPENWQIEERRRFYDETLSGLKGMFSEEDRTKLETMEFDANAIAKYFQLTLDYIRKNADHNGEMTREEEAEPAYRIEVSPKYTAISVNAFSASGKSVIGIPIGRKVNGFKLVELVGHELNSHYRSAMSTRAYFRNLLDPYSNTCPIIPLIPMMSHSLNETLSEGLAKVSDVRVSGAAGMPKPYQVLAINFVQHGHNFKETMEYVFELTRENHKTENTALNNAWNYTYRIFRGQRDTSSRSGYAFSKDKVYLAGFTTVVRNCVEWNDTMYHIEPFMDLLRYSTLTLDELDDLDSRQSGADKLIGHDPYSQWGYGGRGFSKGYYRPDPVEYVASLLLN